MTNNKSQMEMKNVLTGYSLISHPLRKSGRTSLFASRLLDISPLVLSHSILPSQRTAIAPRTSHSVYGPAMLKLEHAGAPPLQARIQSRRGVSDATATPNSPGQEYTRPNRLSAHCRNRKSRAS